jgi:hypothetical protein
LPVSSYNSVRIRYIVLDTIWAGILLGPPCGIFLPPPVCGTLILLRTALKAQVLRFRRTALST